MRKIIFVGTVCLLAALGGEPFLQSRADAQTNAGIQNNLRGKYAVQFTGVVNVPTPFDQANGPFYMNGIMDADGNGHFAAAVLTNYNGAVKAESFHGTYVFGPNDGAFTITISDLEFPALPAGAPVQFTVSGVLANQGTIAKVALSGFSVNGVSPPNGSVIAGEFIKQ